MRGSFCQALPIGCMRVFITPSCSSAVTLERRCSGTLNSLSSCRADDLQQLVARQHQLGDHGHQVLERLDVDADGLARYRSLSLALPLVRVVGEGRGNPRLLGLRLRAVHARLDLGGDEAEVDRRDARVRLGVLDRRQGQLDLHLGLAEGALQLVQRHFAGAQPALQHLRHQRPGHSRLHRLGRSRRARERHRLQLGDEIAVLAARLFPTAPLDVGQDRLDAIDGSEDDAHRLGPNHGAVAELAHQRFGRMGERLKPGQAEEAAGSLDRVDKAEDVVEDPRVVGFLLELHEFDVDHVEALVRLGQELPQQIIHSALHGSREGPSQALGGGVPPNAAPQRKCRFKRLS